jgi:hypothetical protein
MDAIWLITDLPVLERLRHKLIVADWNLERKRWLTHAEQISETEQGCAKDGRAKTGSAKPPDNWKDVIKKAIREKYALAGWPKAS